MRIGARTTLYAGVKVYEECHIGTDCILLKGTTLGAGCVVGAGSVVTGTWPPGSVIAGNPARLIREQKI